MTPWRYYLQPAQEEEEQPPHPEPLTDGPDDDAPDDLPMPKRDMSFSVLFEPHLSQLTCEVDPKTSFSKWALQAVQ